MKKGYLTVYLSMTLAVMLSLVLALVEGARTSATRMRAVCVADIGINSTLSEYNRELLRQYDLIFVDMSYGLAGADISCVRSHLQHYLKQNLDDATPVLSRDLLGMKLSDVVIEEYALASDNSAEAIRRQVSDYMRTTLKGQFTKYFDDLSNELSGAGFDYDVEGRRAQVQGEIDDVELPTFINDKGEEEQVTLNNPADNVNAIRGAGVLGMVMNNTSGVSRTTTDTSWLFSNRYLNSANGISEEERRVGQAAGQYTYVEYLFDKCGYYGSPKSDSLLNYEIEYIIKNKNSDWDNLESVCRNIVLWREAINFVYLMTDAGKQHEAELMAAGLAAITFCPELKDPVKWSILLAWAYVESLQDMKILIEGGGVPVWKNSSTWHTGISSLFHPRSALQSYPGQAGAKYGDYLKTMLLMTNYSKVVSKSIDIMEMDIRLTPGNANFKMDYCMQSFLVDIVMNSTHGHSVEVRRRSGFYYA